MDFQARGTDGVDAELERLATLSGRMRLLVLRRAGLRTSLRAYERAYALAAATRRLALAQATTPAGEAVYPTEAARAAAFTLAPRTTAPCTRWARWPTTHAAGLS